VKTILIADDDRIWAELLATTLMRKGFDVVMAFDAMQATMSAVKRLPDLIVLDVQMPGGTGVDALKRLKMSTKTAMIPVLVVSGSADPAVAQAMSQLGVLRFIAKPTTADDVADVVGTLFGVG
jgi:DNA-binding NtrC family response regulator